MKISLIIPTRNRPNAIHDLCKSAFDTATQNNKLEVCFYVDNDDCVSIRKLDDLEYEFGEHIKHIIGPRCTMSKAANEPIKVATGEIYGYFCDERIFRTFNWDNIVREEFNKVPDKILLVYGYDGYQAKGGFASTGFVHKNWTDTLGYIFPPYFSCDYADTWVDDIVSGLGRKVFVDIFIEHMHFLAGKGQRDQTHNERMERDRRDNNRSIYQQKSPERESDFNKLKSFIENFKND